MRRPLSSLVQSVELNVALPGLARRLICVCLRPSQVLFSHLRTIPKVSIFGLSCSVIQTLLLVLVMPWSVARSVSAQVPERRTNINELSLGSIVWFIESPFWEQYKWRVVGTVSLVILQAVLIVFLLVQRNRRRQAEEDNQRFAQLLEAQHRRLDEVVSNVPGVVWETRIDPVSGQTKTEFVSRYVEEMLGYGEEAFRSKRGFGLSLIPTGESQRVKDETNAILASKKPGVVQFRWVTKDVRVIWVEAHLAVVTDENGEPIGLRGVTMDITARRETEESLRASEQRLRLGLQAGKMIAWDWDPAIDILNTVGDVNEFYGIDRLTTGTQSFSLLHPEDLPEHQSIIDKVVRNGGSYQSEFRIVRPDSGEIIWVEERGEAVIDSNGKVKKLTGVVMDIADRRRAEEELRLSEARFRHMADTAHVLIWISNQNKLCTYFNQRCMDFTGVNLEQLLGEGWLDLVHDEDKQRCMDIYTAAYDRREPFVYEFRIRHAAGNFRWLYSTAAPRFAADGELLGYIGSAVDITDRKLAEESVRESETRFKHMADSAPVMIWIADTNMQCTYFNRRVLDFTGRAFVQLVGEGWLESVHEDDIQRSVDAYTAGYESREPFVLEYRLRRADGEYRWIYDTGTPRFDSKGELLGYIGSAVDITERRVAEEALQIAHQEVSQLKNQLEAENLYLQEEIRLTHNVDEIVGESNAIKYVMFKVEQVAQTDTSVLILGETGTGKELVARAIHSQSDRKERPLVKVNCAALSASLIESELFGHEKGAFTGAAARKIGRFELADGATIFLDEIGELPLGLQPKLLRVIQEGELERLGSSKTIKVDVRLIAATNRNLKLEVEKGNFREDLWYRLNVFPITVPPLRQRKEDIPLMVEHFARMFSKKVGKTITSISSATMQKFHEHSWPGNVRELSNVVERALVTAQGSVLHVADQFEQPKETSELTKTLEEIERDHITRTLDQTGWRVEGPNGAARILGINPSTLRTRMVKLGIQKSFKTSVGSG
jgi:PAS domain S-box-containing protein